jgi:eukaryotic-like serine/threonine-protein kinase
MTSGGIAKKDIFLAILLGLFFIGGLFTNLPFFNTLEHMVYDAGVNATGRKPGDAKKIVIIAIDDASIEKVGRWPWSRATMADMLDKLSRARAKAVALQILFDKPQIDPGLPHIRKIKEFINKTSFPRAARSAVNTINRYLEQAEFSLDVDKRLGASVAKLRVYMPMLFNRNSKALGKRDKPLPEFIRKNRLKKIVAKPGVKARLFTTDKVFFPIEAFGKEAAGIGSNTLSLQADGGARSALLLVENYGEYYPSLPLLLAARSFNLSARDIQVSLGEGVSISRLKIKTNSSMQMLSAFYKNAETGGSAFKIYPFYQVLNGKVPLSSFRNKIVIIGPTAYGLGASHSTPVDKIMSSPELTANVVASILNQDFYTRPNWASYAEILILLLVWFYLMLALPRFRAKPAALISLLLLAGLIGIEIYMLIGGKIWIKTAVPVLFLLTGHLLITTRRFFATERLKTSAESESAQTNRMLGLAFQGQGQLDMAMDKFRKLPVDASVLDLIYNLALDFERKRQFSKAVSGYDYILQHDKNFRDVQERKKRGKHHENTIIMGPGYAPGGALMLSDTMDQKPTLGRYEVEKEIGKGAMGAVYLGRDPKINRVVAIKTMALAHEFEQKDLEKVKQRFFREAETAGSLSHPNIVTIYDAGEDHELAYIAMEFLQGKDLTNYISSEKILPIKWVLELGAQVADALDYAHKQEVVHRDIKPANIMYNGEDKSIKVTDFGIARITASNRTKTGVVLGTPSYMSPEQVAGKRVDGRSDLFSLGVTLYELFSGHLPFNGETMAALMYQIANSKHPDINKVRANCPACVRKMIDKALQKDAKKRFQTGAEFKKAIYNCIQSLPKEMNGRK